MNKAGIVTDLFHGAEGSSKGNGGNPFGSATPLVHSLSKLSKEVSVLESEKEALEAVRGVQHLKLIKIQNQILDAVTEEKLEAASLPDLVRAYALLKDKEHVMTGKATSITGIVGYLIQLEKEDARKIQEQVSYTDLEMQEGTFQVSVQEETPYEDEDSLPRL